MATRTRAKPASLPAPDQQWPYDRCRAEVTGRRCYFPASNYHSMNPKPNSGECRMHDGCRGVSVLAAIEESEQWYDARQRGEDVPLFYTSWDGKKVPGFPSEDQRMREANRSAAAYCKNLGLTTPAQCRAWLRKNKLLVKRQPVYERQPGDDDE